MKTKEPDPFALEVDNNECNAAIRRLEGEGKVIHRLEVIPHGYQLRFYTPKKESDHLVNLLLDFSAEL